jgi:hypothetical protein
MSLRSFSAVIFILLSCLLSGCFSTLQTAKVEDGFSFTSGIYNYTVEKHYPKRYYEDYYVFILMPRYGWAATENRIGAEIGIRAMTDLVTEGKSSDPFWIILEEFKLQIPKNKHIDLAFGFDFYLIFPGSIYILASKDLSKTFTLYGCGELFGALYNITLEENETGFYPKMTIGTQVNFNKNVSGLIEMEKWFNSDWDWRENLRFAAGVKFVPFK